MRLGQKNTSVVILDPSLDAARTRHSRVNLNPKLQVKFSNQVPLSVAVMD